jgi:hypothetical protein
MNTIKANYKTPRIEQIVIDHEISLALSSTPPEGPNEILGKNNAPDYFNPDNVFRA